MRAFRLAVVACLSVSVAMACGVSSAWASVTIGETGENSTCGHVGTNKLRFQGRLSRSKKLKPGRYTLTVTATDSAGNRSNAKATSFTIVR